MTIDQKLDALAEKLRHGRIALSAARVQHKALLIEADAERLRRRHKAPETQAPDPEGHEKYVELRSGTRIECNWPGELCLSPIGSVINHRKRLFYNLDTRDRYELADIVTEVWSKWAVERP
jgi:hypothetical protein